MVHIMRTSHHPNLVRYIDSYVVDSTRLWVVTEAMDCGCLFDLHQNQLLQPNEAHLAYVCREVRTTHHTHTHLIHTRHRHRPFTYSLYAFNAPLNGALADAEGARVPTQHAPYVGRV